MKPRSVQMLLISVLIASTVPPVVVSSGGMDSTSRETQPSQSALEQNNLPQSGKQSREGQNCNGSGAIHTEVDQNGPGDRDRELLRELADEPTTAPAPETRQR